MIQSLFLSNPKLFGVEHLVYILLACIVLAVSLFFILKKKNDEKFIRKIVIIISILNLIFILMNRISIYVANDYDFKSLYPTTFCGFTSLVFPLCLLFCKRDSKILHWITYCAFLGGLLTIIYPDFIGQDESFFYIPTISGLLHHTSMLFNSIIIIASGYFTPSIYKEYCLPLGLCVMMTIGIFNITALKYDTSMYILEYLIPGTIFSWYFVGFLFLLLHFLFLLFFDLFKNKDEAWIKKILSRK